MTDQRKAFVVSFSGGKDSTATWLYLERELGLDVTCVFADTGHESEVTYRYLDYLEAERGMWLVRVRGVMGQLSGFREDRDGPPDAPLSMLALAKHKKRFPSATRRFCTTELKLKPMRAWLARERAAFPETRFVMVSGVRRQESPKRAAISCDFGFDEFMGVDRWLPLLDWTWQEVFAVHRRHRVPPNPLYQEGMSRVGCWPCIMARKSELAAIARRYPEAFARLAEMERACAGACPGQARTFFSRTTTAKRYRSVLDQKTGMLIPSAEDVRRWALSVTPRVDLFSSFAGFEEEGDDVESPSCSSVYGLCE